MPHTSLGTEQAEGEWITWLCTRTVLGRGKEPGRDAGCSRDRGSWSL